MFKFEFDLGSLEFKIFNLMDHRCSKRRFLNLFWSLWSALIAESAVFCNVSACSKISATKTLRTLLLRPMQKVFYTNSLLSIFVMSCKHIETAGAGLVAWLIFLESLLYEAYIIETCRLNKSHYLWFPSKDFRANFQVRLWNITVCIQVNLSQSNYKQQ